jgi:isocitrate dehydrogenase
LGLSYWGSGFEGADGSLMQGNYTVTLIEGDGIGPEISQSVKDIFAAAKVYQLVCHGGDESNGA